ncbi:MAG: hypothetical protein ABI459_09280 [Deltaproteobacteria bacterium]
MLKSILAAAVLVVMSTGAYAGSGSCGAWADTSVLAEVVLDDLKLMLADDVAKPA